MQDAQNSQHRTGAHLLLLSPGVQIYLHTSLVALPSLTCSVSELARPGGDHEVLGHHERHAHILQAAPDTLELHAARGTDT